MKRLGNHHPDVATTLAATAGLLKALGRAADAETVYRLVRDACRMPACMVMQPAVQFKDPGVQQACTVCASPEHGRAGAGDAGARAGPRAPGGRGRAQQPGGAAAISRQGAAHLLRVDRMSATCLLPAALSKYIYLMLQWQPVRCILADLRHEHVGSLCASPRLSATSAAAKAGRPATITPPSQ